MSRQKKCLGELEIREPKVRPLSSYDLTLLDDRDTVGSRRKRRIICIRLALIPVTDGIEIVTAIIRMAMFDRVLQIPLESHRIIAVPAVHQISVR